MGELQPFAPVFAGEGFEITAFQEGRAINFTYYGISNGKKVRMAYIKGDLAEAGSLQAFHVEQAWGAPESALQSKRITAAVLDRLFRHVSRVMREKGVRLFYGVTNERMARFMQKNFGAKLTQTRTMGGERFEVSLLLAEKGEPLTARHRKPVKKEAAKKETLRPLWKRLFRRR